MNSLDDFTPSRIWFDFKSPNPIDKKCKIGCLYTSDTQSTALSAFNSRSPLNTSKFYLPWLDTPKMVLVFFEFTGRYLWSLE